MYGWIWQHLPGNTLVRALISVVLVLIVIFLLFQYVFPWAEPLVPFNAAGEAFTPVARLMKAALERGLYLMTHWNVVMVCPPLTITRDELDEGLSILDEALAPADESTT
jgi:hypothetical protein